MSAAGSVVGAVPRGLFRRAGSRLWDFLPAAVVLVAGIALWQVLVTVLHVQRFLLPKPTEIVSALVDNWHVLWSAGLFTFREAVGGFAIGSGMAVLVAVALSRFPRVGRALLPYAVAANAVPIIAFAPIMNNWFGLLNPLSKMALSAMICFFPVMINTLRGLTSVPPASVELMRSYAAGETAVLWKVRLPNSLPYLFAGLRVATVLSMIGAVVGDYFGGSTQSLGVFIVNKSSLFVFDQAWAAIVVASLLGVGFYLAAGIVERFALRWHVSARGTEGR
ncbi:MAG TPA: ABC transporter permease [Actinomycetota bacterium]